MASRTAHLQTQPLVLIVDDDPRITKLVSLVLRDEGFRSVSAWSSDEAISVAESARPDVILLDVGLDDADGSHLLTRLKYGRPVRVILLGERVTASDIARGLDSGADDFIVKPFHPDELAARVRAVARTGVSR
jgi:DNA-binding response OmpR family regulator